jgi:hypothetical protein
MVGVMVAVGEGDAVKVPVEEAVDEGDIGNGVRVVAVAGVHPAMTKMSIPRSFHGCFISNHILSLEYPGTAC